MAFTVTTKWFFFSGAIKSIIAKGISVYLSVSFWAGDHWIAIMDLQDELPSPYCEQVQAMVKFMADNKISGVLLESLDLFVSDIF